MKKFYLFISLIVVTIGNAQIQTEDFEASGLPTGWTTNITSGTFDWTFGSGVMPGGTDFSTNAALFDDDAAGDNGEQNISELVSPAVDVTSYTTLNLSFEYSLQAYVDSGTLTVEVWDGASWVGVLFQDVDTDPNVVNFDVTAYKNAAFQVRFTYDDENDWAWGAGVDNFSLTGTLATNSFEKSKFSVYPNPTADVININTADALTNMTISDVNGKTIKSIANGTTRVDISNLDSGIYFLTYDTDGKHYLNKIVRK